MASIGGQLIPKRTLFLVCAESALIAFALLLATASLLPTTHAAVEHLRQGSTLFRLLIAFSICMVSFYYSNFYGLDPLSSRFDTGVALTRGLGCALLIMAGLCIFGSGLSLGRGVIPIAVPTILLLMLSSRAALRSSAKRARGAEKVLLVGSGCLGKKIICELRDRSDLNYKVVGCLCEGGQTPSETAPLPNLGSVKDLERVVAEYHIDRIVLSMRNRREEMPLTELMRLKFQGVRIEELHSLYERLAGRIVVEELPPSFFIFSEGFKASRRMRWTKRSVDLLISVTGLLLSAPILLLVALAIRLEDGGPVFYCQKRVGKDQQTFKIFKFRSMRPSAPNAVPSWTVDGDKRITRVGKYLRLFRFDELPQFINVLRGDMSVIGPRPEQPYFCRSLSQEIPYFNYRHTIRPGITGWAQVKYRYGATTEDAIRKLELDLFYIKHLSITLDLVVIVETVKVIIFGRGK